MIQQDQRELSRSYNHKIAKADDVMASCKLARDFESFLGAVNFVRGNGNHPPAKGELVLGLLTAAEVKGGELGAL